MPNKIKELIETLNKETELKNFEKHLKESQISSDDLQNYLYFSQKKYTRNLIFQNDKFELMTLCWEAKQETPIHDHNGSRGIVLVTQGTLHEVIYKQTPNPPCLIKVSEVNAGEKAITSIDDSIGYHKIINNSGERAVSLHLYAKPIEAFYVYNSNNLKRCLKTPCFYSKFGNLPQEA